MNVTIQKKKNSLSDFQGLLALSLKWVKIFCSRLKQGATPAPISSIYMVAAWSIYLYLYTQMY